MTINKRVTNLDEKIFLATFSKPRYKAEISNLIYGREQKSIYPKIDQLIKKGWIRYTDFTPTTEINDDGRANKRIYLKGTIEPIYKEIINRFNKKDIVLTKNNREKLKKYLDSDDFRIYCGDYDKKKSINLLVDQLSIYSSFIVAFYNFVKRFGAENEKDVFSDNTFYDLGPDLLGDFLMLNENSLLIFKMFNSSVMILTDLMYEFINSDKIQQKKIIESLNEFNEEMKDIFS